MSFYLRPLVAAVGLALAFSVQAAKPAKAAKPAAKQATAAAPAHVASSDLELAHTSDRLVNSICRRWLIVSTRKPVAR